MSEFDVIVIGGGPGGSTAASFLTAAGKRVVLIEKEQFPRFHIGESLLPYNTQIFEELGVKEDLEDAGFIIKKGAQFALGNGAFETKVRFADGLFTEYPSAFQVERSIFDQILLNNARRKGVDIREGCQVSNYEIAPERVSVSCSDGVLSARFLIDASGTHNFTGNHEKIRVGNPKFRKLALFAHFEGVKMPEEEGYGDIIIVRLEDAWFWMIPLTKTKTSIGLVVDSKRSKERMVEKEAFFEETITQSTYLMERMASAKRMGPLRAITDFSYTNKRFMSPRLVRVGDAAGFMDPIFSSGVYLAMVSAKQAAHCVSEAIDRNLALTVGMQRYETELRRSMKVYWTMIEGFYRRSFIEVFIQPEPVLELPSAVNAILAGRLDNSWRVRWRLWIFLLLTRLQAYVKIVPQRRFD